MITVFILTYVGMDYLNSWFDASVYSEGVEFHIVDNGKQEIPERLKPYVIHQTSRNVGCAGGWNLCCHLGFGWLDREKIIVGQDDGMFNESILEEVDRHTTPNQLVGTYDRSFDFSLFGIHRDLFNEVGEFDENFINVGCEDNDYKHRLKLNGKTLYNLGVTANMNSNFTVKTVPDRLEVSSQYNDYYIKRKWGKDYEYTCPFNDPDIATDDPPIQKAMIQTHGEITEFPSKTEYQRFLHPS